MSSLDRFSKQPPNSRHHYAFAHYALRHFAFAQPVRLFGILASELRKEFFDELLKDLDGRISLEDGQRNFTGSDIGFTGVLIQGRPCVVLTMPPANNPAEAYFVAILSRLPTDALQAFLAGNTSGESLIEYFTLERPSLPAPGGEGVLCAWTENDCHLNYGPGPVPRLEDFLLFLKQHVRAA
jgi:hypothetical protein